MTDSWTRTATLSSDQRLEVLNLLNRTEVSLGREALDEGCRRIVVHGWTGVHYLKHHNGALIQYALLNGSQKATIEMCGGGFDRDLLSMVITEHEIVDWWTRDSGDDREGNVVRTLQLLHLHLPVPVSPVPAGTLLRNFESGRDDNAWLAQNNAAFADHPEQGAWLPVDLDERTHEPWFDPSGFLILEIEGTVVASCWTKVHELHPDRFGEIYVISVDPKYQGRGLGKVMVSQGLDVLRRKGVSEAVLFVDESNIGARGLYESLGFTVQREDKLIRFVRD